MSAKQILCMKWGAMYGPEYVNKLYGMAQRNVTGAFKLFCFTDNTAGVRREVECLPLPALGCELPKHDHRGRELGKWPKVAIWNKDLGGLNGTGLFLDLDSVIVSNIDDYFTYGDPNDVITARNWTRPMRRMGQTSIFRFPISGHPYMLENLRANPVEVACHYRFEQNYVTQCIHGGIRFWPHAWTKHFGIHCIGPWPLRALRPAPLPRGVKIVTFPGDPKPPDAIVGRWSHHLPKLGRIEHLKWTWANRKTLHNWRKHMRCYILPCPWVEAHWRE